MMTDMLKWVTDTLQAAGMGPMALPLAFLLGLVSAVASACCTLPAMGMLVAYSGTRQDVDQRSAFTSAVWFLVGTTLALIIFGFVAGLVGQAAQAFLGLYWMRRSASSPAFCWSAQDSICWRRSKWTQWVGLRWNDITRNCTSPPDGTEQIYLYCQFRRVANN